MRNVFVVLAVLTILIWCIGLNIAASGIRGNLIFAYGYDGLHNYEVPLDDQQIIKYFGKTRLPENVYVGDFNNDGKIEVVITGGESFGGFLGGPMSYTFCVFGREDRKPITYLSVQCKKYQLEPYHLADGTTGFANLPMIWNRKIYHWQANSYQLTNYIINSCEKYEEIHKRQIKDFYKSLLSLEFMVGILFSVVPVMLLNYIFEPAISGTYKRDRLVAGFILKAIFLTYLIYFCVTNFQYGYESAIAQPIFATLPVIGMLIYLLMDSILKMRLKRT